MAVLNFPPPDLRRIASGLRAAADQAVGENRVPPFAKSAIDLQSLGCRSFLHLCFTSRSKSVEKSVGLSHRGRCSVKEEEEEECAAARFCECCNYRKTRVWLGTFETADEVARAYDEAVVLMSGRNAKTNFPSSPSGATAKTTSSPSSSGLVPRSTNCCYQIKSAEEKP